MQKDKIAVIGGENIGSSLAYDCVLRGYSVLSHLAKEQSPEGVLARISWKTDFDAISEGHFLVENITENVDLKKALYSHLSEFLNGSAIIAANTSCIPITKLSSYYRDPSKVIGVHFMNPV